MNLDNTRFQAADFRIRLFLSVDLSGSTAYKNSRVGQNREGSSPKWVTVFENFYRDFPARFASKYENNKNSQSGSDACPKLWKAVGDELIFCGRVTNKRSIMLAIISFIETLNDYRKMLQDEDIALNLKGASWVASFPEPNRAVQLRQAQDCEQFLSASEALEAAADERPFDYDFLGKAIDTGFRVASFSTPERFVLSVQLAKLLASVPEGSGMDYQIRFDRPKTLKGVNGGEPYPVLYFDTLEHLRTRTIIGLERTLLNIPSAPARDDVNKYLNAYCTVVGTDELRLPITASDASLTPPPSYGDHQEKISAHLAAEKTRGAETSVAEVDDTENDNSLEEAALNPVGFTEHTS